MGKKRKLKKKLKKHKKGFYMFGIKENKALELISDKDFDDLIKLHDKGGAFNVKESKFNCWDSGIKIIKTCGHINVSKYHIEFHLLAHKKIEKLKKVYPNLEWLAYLVGSVDHDNHKVSVTDLVIPDSQKVTGTSVYNVEYNWESLADNKVIIGVIHSHNTMGAFFSGTDDAYINQNHDVSIVVSTAAGREIKAQVRVKTLCNSYILAENIEFSVKYPQLFDESEFESELSEKIISHSSISSCRGIIGRSFLNNFTGYDTENNDFLDLEELEYEYPEKMTKLDIRDELLFYYEEEDVDEMIRDGSAVNELKIIRKKVKENSDKGFLDQEDGWSSVDFEEEFEEDEDEDEDYEFDDKFDYFKLL